MRLTDGLTGTAKECVRHEDALAITIYTVEGYFGIIKRWIDGIYITLESNISIRTCAGSSFATTSARMNDQDRSVLAIKKTSDTRLAVKPLNGADFSFRSRRPSRRIYGTNILNESNLLRWVPA